MTQSKAVQELRESLRNLAYERSKAEAVIDELEAYKDQNKRVIAELAEAHQQLAAANTRLAWFDANKPEDMPDVQEAVIKKLGLVDGGALSECQKQLTTVTEAIQMAKGCCLREAKSCGCLIGIDRALEALKGKQT